MASCPGKFLRRIYNLITTWKIRMRCGWIFQQANDPKHTALGMAQSITTLKPIISFKDCLCRRTSQSPNWALWEITLFIQEASWSCHCKDSWTLHVNSCIIETQLARWTLISPTVYCINTARCFISWLVLYNSLFALIAIINRETHPEHYGLFISMTHTPGLRHIVSCHIGWCMLNEQGIRPLAVLVSMHI